jgi:hypothetical protein
MRDWFILTKYENDLIGYEVFRGTLSDIVWSYRQRNWQVLSAETL